VDQGLALVVAALDGDVLLARIVAHQPDLAPPRGAGPEPTATRPLPTNSMSGALAAPWPRLDQVLDRLGLGAGRLDAAADHHLRAWARRAGELLGVGALALGEGRLGEGVFQPR
jgi:hypothetical protein